MLIVKATQAPREAVNPSALSKRKNNIEIAPVPTQDIPAVSGLEDPLTNGIHPRDVIINTNTMGRTVTKKSPDH